MFAIHPVRTLIALTAAGGAAIITGLAQASASDLPAFACTDRSGGTAGVTGTLTSIRVAHHDGYDRLVFGFATSTAVPPYEVDRQASSTFVRDASGQPVTLQGSAGLRTVFRGSDTTAGLPADLKAGLPEIREVANIGNFERVVSYGIGLSQPVCFRVIELSGPSRLVIDVQTPAGSSAVAAANQSTAQPTAGDTSPSNLASTGHQTAGDRSSIPAASPAPVMGAAAGLLLLVAGLSVAGLRRFRRP